jgi:hypothetical protein
MKLLQRLLEPLPSGALGLLATNPDLGHQLQPGHMNDTERPFQLLPGSEPIAFLTRLSLPSWLPLTLPFLHLCREPRP